MDLIVDPYGCGCTECGTGEYVSLDRLWWDDKKMARVFLGDFIDNTGFSEEVWSIWLTENMTPDAVRRVRRKLTPK